MVEERPLTRDLVAIDASLHRNSFPSIPPLSQRLHELASQILLSLSFVARRSFGPETRAHLPVVSPTRGNLLRNAGGESYVPFHLGDVNPGRELTNIRADIG